MKNIAIIGHGFVGKAIDYGFSSNDCKKWIVDPKQGTTIADLPDIMDFIFVCVPTPMGKDGRIDSTIIEQVMHELETTKVSGIIVIKSTITPDIIEKLTQNGTNLHVVYNPEFLTEKSANEDFVNPFMHIFGGPAEATKEVEDLYKFYSICKPCPTYHMSAVDASFVKYGINCFLASKVLWFNQFYDIITQNNGNFGKIVGAITTDSRVGRSHTTVPGFDGRRGYGGPCFPKDASAFLNFSKDCNTPFTVLDEVIKVNNQYRSQYTLDDREKEQNITFGNNKQ